MLCCLCELADSIMSTHTWRRRFTALSCLLGMGVDCLEKAQTSTLKRFNVLVFLLIRFGVVLLQSLNKLLEIRLQLLDCLLLRLDILLTVGRGQGLVLRNLLLLVIVAEV